MFLRIEVIMVGHGRSLVSGCQWTLKEPAANSGWGMATLDTGCSYGLKLLWLGMDALLSADASGP